MDSTGNAPGLAVTAASAVPQENIRQNMNICATASSRLVRLGIARALFSTAQRRSGGARTGLYCARRHANCIDGRVLPIVVPAGKDHTHTGCARGARELQRRIEQLAQMKHAARRRRIRRASAAGPRSSSRSPYRRLSPLMTRIAIRGLLLRTLPLAWINEHLIDGGRLRGRAWPELDHGVWRRGIDHDVTRPARGIVDIVRVVVRHTAHVDNANVDARLQRRGLCNSRCYKVRA